MCWCFNERDHTLTTVPIVSVHWQPETGAVREYTHFPNIQVYVIIHDATNLSRRRQLIKHLFI
jgi:hypothetical protein